MYHIYCILYFYFLFYIYLDLSCIVFERKRNWFDLGISKSNVAFFNIFNLSNIITFAIIVAIEIVLLNIKKCIEWQNNIKYIKWQKI